MSIISTSSDNDLRQIEHYQKYPEMLPFVGTGYGLGQLPSVLLIGESHYLPPSSTFHLDVRAWYEGNHTCLNDEEQRWICTRRLIDKTEGRWSARGHAIYRNLNRCLKDIGYQGQNAFAGVAYMNAFQRPAKSGVSIEIIPLDIRHSTQTLLAVISILQPIKTIFVSRLAFKTFGKEVRAASLSYGGTVFSVPHPASPWWNRKSKRGTGREQLLAALKL